MFLCCHVLARHAEPFVDESDVWTELDQVTRSVKWEDRVTAAELAEATMKETEKSLAREELLVSIAELEDNIVAGELNDSIDESVDEDDVLNRVELGGARERERSLFAGDDGGGLRGSDGRARGGGRSARGDGRRRRRDARDEQRGRQRGAGGVPRRGVERRRRERRSRGGGGGGGDDEGGLGGEIPSSRGYARGGDGTEKKKEKSDKKSKAKKAPSAAFGTEEWQKQQKSNATQRGKDHQGE